MLYDEGDLARNAARLKKEELRLALFAVPAAAAAVAAFFLRVEWLCMAAVFFCGAALILLLDLRVMPLVRYGRFLRDAARGLTRRTAGTLVRVGEDRVYEEGVWMRECILNVYEDQSPEGERRFLLDCAKEIPSELIGRDVALTSHGSAVMDVQALEAAVGQTE